MLLAERRARARARAKLSYKTLRPARIAAGKCASCGHADASEGSLYCARCKARAIARANEARFRRVLAGQCLDCKRAPKAGFERCEKHLKRDRTRWIERSHARTV